MRISTWGMAIVLGALAFGVMPSHAAKKPRAPKATFEFARTLADPPLEHAAWNPTDVPEVDVFLPTGAVYHERTLLRVPGGIHPLEIRLRYHGDQVFDGGFGKRWRSSIDGVVIPQENGDVVHVDAHGIEHRFVADGPDFVSPSDACAVLAAARKGKKQKIKEYHLVFDDRTIHVFDQKGRFTRLINPDGSFYAFKRFKDGRWKKIVSSWKRKVSAKYDRSRRLVQIKDHAKRRHGFVYDLEGRLTAIERPLRPGDGAPVAWRYTYDDSDRLATVLQATGETIATLTYAGDGGVDAVVSPDATTTFTRNGLTGTVNGRNGVDHAFQYDAMGRLTQHDVMLKAGGSLTHVHEYDNIGRRIREVLPSGREFVTEYPPAGDPRTRWSPLVRRDRTVDFPREAERVWTWTYRDDSNEKTSEVDPSGARTDWTYDDRGNVTSMRLPAIKTLAEPNPPFERPLETYEYDALNRRTAIVYADGARDEFEYGKSKKDGDQILRQIRDVGSGDDPATGLPFANEVTDFTYDAAGNLSRQRFADGATNQWTHDTWDSTTTFTDANDIVTTYTYDAVGRLTGESRPLLDSDGNDIGSGASSLRTTYDALGNAIREERHNGFETRVRTAEYDAGNGRPSTETDPSGSTMRLVYDELDRIATQTLATGTSLETEIEYAYDANGNRVRVEDGNDLGPTHVYDGYDRRVRIVSEEGVTTNFALDEMGRTLERVVRDSAGDDVERARYAYDPFGNLIRVERDRFVDPNGPIDVEVTEHCYDLRGARVQTIDPSGVPMTWQYDGRGALFRSDETELDRAEEFEYDAIGRPVVQREILGASLPTPTIRETRFEYDGNGNLTAVTDPTGARQAFELDTEGHLHRITDPAGTVSESVVDADGNTRSSTVTSGNASLTSTNLYDAASRLVETTGTDGRTFRYTYDARGQTTAVDLVPDQGDPVRTATYAYDPAGNEVSRQMGAAQPIVTVYDKDYNVVSVTANDLTQVIGVDGLGRITSAQSTTSLGTISVLRTYDSMGNIVSEQQGNNVLVTSQFTDGNKRTELQDGQGVTYDFEYDSAGVLQGVDRNDADLYDFDRVPGTTMPAAIRHPRQTTVLEYDPLDRLVRSSSTTPEGVSSDWRLTFGPRGEFQEQRRNDGTVIETFEYDGFGRPTRIERTRPGNGAPVTTDDRFEYDAAIDRPTRMSSSRDGGLPSKFSGNLTYDALGRIQTFDGRAYTYGTHLGATNAFEQRPGFPQIEMNFVLDALGRLTSATDKSDGSVIAEFQYDVWGRPLRSREQDSFGALLTRQRIFDLCNILWEGPPPGEITPGFGLRYTPTWMRPGYMLNGFVQFGDSIWQPDCFGQTRQSFNLNAAVVQEVNFDRNAFGVSLYEAKDINGELHPFRGAPSLHTLSAPPGSATSNATGIVFDWLGNDRDPGLPRGLPFVGPFRNGGGGLPPGPAGGGGGGAPQPRADPFKPQPGGGLWLLIDPGYEDQLEREKCERAFNGICKLLAEGTALAERATQRQAAAQAKIDELRRDARHARGVADALRDSALERARDLAAHLNSVESMDFAAEMALIAASLGSGALSKGVTQGASRYAIASGQLARAGTASAKRFAGANVSKATGEIVKESAKQLGKIALEQGAEKAATAGLNTSFGLFTQWIITIHDLVEGTGGYEGMKAEIESDLGVARIKYRLAESKSLRASQCALELEFEIADIMDEAAANNRRLARAFANAAAWLTGPAGARKRYELARMQVAQSAAGIR